MTQMRQIRLDGLHNLRDLGGVGGVLRDRLWRADCPQAIGPQGVARLHALGLRSVIDLREPVEALPDAALYGPGILWHNAPIFGALDLSNAEIVEAEDPLLALYLRALTESRERFAQALRLVAEAPRGTVLIHCTVGKDRTGMVAALLLRLAGVTDEAIIADYTETGRHIGPVLDGLRERAAAKKWNLALLSRYWRSEAETMRGFLAALDDRHGGAVGYLESAGLTPAEIQTLRHRLTRSDDDGHAATAASATPENPTET